MPASSGVAEYLQQFYTHLSRFGWKAYSLPSFYQKARGRHMRIYSTSSEQFPIPADRLQELECLDRLSIVLLDAISGIMREVLGPMFWAALIVLFLQAELLTN